MQSQNNINYGCLKGEWSVIESGLFLDFLNKDKQGMVLQADMATQIQSASVFFFDAPEAIRASTSSSRGDNRSRPEKSAERYLFA
jgi:hypothetical protein